MDFFAYRTDFPLKTTFNIIPETYIFEYILNFSIKNNVQKKKNEMYLPSN